MDELNKAVKAAGNEQDPERLTALAADERPRVRAAVASNDATPAVTLATLAADADVGIRRRVARNAATPDDVVLTLAGDPAIDVRTDVAKRTQLSPSVLTRLLDDPEADVRIELAQRSDLDAATDARLATDGNADVRGYLAGRTSDPELLRRLAADPEESVVDVVGGNDATPADVLADIVGRGLAGVRTNASCPPEVLARLASHADDSVRCDIAYDPRTPVEALVRLARDPEERVRRALCGNTSLTAEVIAVLEKDEVDTVRRLVTVARQRLVEATLTEPIFLESRPEALACVLLEVAGPGQGISTIGGGPRLSPGMSVPVCRTCTKPMSLFLQLELGGAVPAHVPAGNRLLVFACIDHDDIPSLLHGTEALPADYWNLDGHYRLFLAPSGTAAMYAPDPRIAERSLVATATTDEIEEIGPRTGRFFVGRQGLKVGGVPSWAESLERHTCACGAPMRFVAQIPENFAFPLKGGDDEAMLFLGNEVYLFSCEKACDPRAVWPVVQN